MGTIKSIIIENHRFTLEKQQFSRFAVCSKKNRLTLNLRSQRRSKMYPNTMKNDVCTSKKQAKTQMAQKIAKHASRDAPRRRLSGHKCMFLANLGSRLGPAGFQNGLRSPPGTLQKLHQSSSRRKNRPNQLPGGSRKVPRHPEGPPRHHFLMIFAWFPKAILE